MAVATYYYEIEEIDGAIVELAAGEARTFAALHSSLFYAAPGGSGGDIDGKLKQFLETREANAEGHFIIAEIYGADRRSLGEATHASWGGIEAALSIRKHLFPDGDEPHYDKVVLEGRLYIRVVVPLHVGPQHQALGFFEGVYHVSDARIAEIRKRLISTVLLVVGVVLGTTLFLVPVMIAVGRRLMSLSRQLVMATIETLEVLGTAIAKRDSDTGAHNYRVTIFAIRLAEAVGLAPEAIRALIKGAFLHDVGKIAISDSILLKPGPLTAEEFTVMKQHVAHGFDIVRSAASLHGAADVVLFHHEKYDGSGYLKGLTGQAIPVTARIFAIADVFDALVSRRPYKEPMAFEAALAIITGGAGRHFDPGLVSAFVTIARPLYDAFAGQDDSHMARSALETLTRRYFAVGRG